MPTFTLDLVCNISEILLTNFVVFVFHSHMRVTCKPRPPNISFETGQAIRTLLNTRKATTEKRVAAKMRPTTKDVSGVDGSVSCGESL